MARQLIPVTMFSKNCVRKINAKNLALNFAWIVKIILIFTVIRPRAEQLWSRVSSPSKARDFTVAHSVQACGSHVVFYILVTGFSFLRVKAAGARSRTLTCI
jgi:hypothetical protein